MNFSLRISNQKLVFTGRNWSRSRPVGFNIGSFIMPIFPSGRVQLYFKFIFNVMIYFSNDILGLQRIIL